MKDGPPLAVAKRAPPAITLMKEKVCMKAGTNKRVLTIMPAKRASKADTLRQVRHSLTQPSVKLAREELSRRLGQASFQMQGVKSATQVGSQPQEMKGLLSIQIYKLVKVILASHAATGGTRSQGRGRIR